jgi:hypothetical protein
VEHRAQDTGSHVPRIASVPLQYAPTPVLYHGTRATAAQKILRDGFKRPSARSYTGTAINLTESMTVAYEYGAYENRGAVLRIRLRPEIAWSDGLREDPSELGRGSDALLDSGTLQALKTYGGNVWLTTPSAIASIERLEHRDAVGLLLQEIAADGKDCGYNSVVQTYATWFRGESFRQAWEVDEIAGAIKKFHLTPGVVPISEKRP